STRKPRPRRSATRASTSGSASAGGAARSKEGRRPRATDPARVNWETIRKAPPTAARSRFILPASSSKTRKPASFSAAARALSSPSPRSIPTSTSRPRPISPTVSPPTFTEAVETRCKTRRIFSVYIERRNFPRIRSLSRRSGPRDGCDTVTDSRPEEKRKHGQQSDPDLQSRPRPRGAVDPVGAAERQVHAGHQPPLAGQERPETGADRVAPDRRLGQAGGDRRPVSHQGQADLPGRADTDQLLGRQADRREEVPHRDHLRQLPDARLARRRRRVRIARPVRLGLLLALPGPLVRRGRLRRARRRRHPLLEQVPVKSLKDFRDGEFSRP